MITDERGFLTRLFEAAVAAADPEQAILPFLPKPPKGRTVVLGCGKGAAQLARAFEKHWTAPYEGVIVTRYGYAEPCENLTVLEANHPVPDTAGLAASEALLRAVEGLGPDDLVVALICGGGSALLPSPAGPLSFEDEVAVNEALLASGAPISAMNLIRKHISGIKGGRLAAAAHPAKVVSLVVSDVPGDDPAQVASGPTVPDPTRREAALEVIARYGMSLPAPVMEWLKTDAANAPMPDDPVFAGNEVHVIASAAKSLEAAAAAARSEGVPAVILSDAIEGEARDVGRVHAAIAREIAGRGQPFEAPVVMLSGGETTVTLRAKGKGGRNTEFLLSAALDLDGVDRVYALAADTDGIDGSEDNAGAFADGGSVARIRAAGVDPAASLAGNDAWTAFEAAGDIFRPGPTGTNVNDFRTFLVK